MRKCRLRQMTKTLNGNLNKENIALLSFLSQILRKCVGYFREYIKNDGNHYEHVIADLYNIWNLTTFVQYFVEVKVGVNITLKL